MACKEAQIQEQVFSLPLHCNKVKVLVPSQILVEERLRKDFATEATEQFFSTRLHFHCNEIKTKDFSETLV
jgi:hypothetical protein